MTCCINARLYFGRCTASLQIMRADGFRGSIREYVRHLNSDSTNFFNTTVWIVFTSVSSSGYRSNFRIGDLIRVNFYFVYRCVEFHVGDVNYKKALQIFVEVILLCNCSYVRPTYVVCVAQSNMFSNMSQGCW